MGLDHTTTEVINGHKWTVRPFPARKAIQLKVRLAKAVGPAIAELMPAFGAMQQGKDVEQGIDLAVLPRVADALARGLGEDAFVDTLVELMEFSSRDDTQITGDHFDIIFAGNYAEMYKAVWLILKVNYSDFIGMVGGSAIGTHLKALTQETPKT